MGRLLRWTIGLALLSGYVLAGASVYWLYVFLLTSPPDLLPSAIAIVAVTVVGAYASYRFGTQQLLAGIEATEIGPNDVPWLFRRIDAFTAEMNIERPRVFIARLGAPNALALGGVRSGTLVIDVSLFKLLQRTELAAIVAHELAHIENNDAFVQTMAYSALRTAVGLLMVPLVPLLLVMIGLARAGAWIRGRPSEWTRSPAMVVYVWLSLGVTVLSIAVTALIRAHSRQREYDADDRAVEVTNDPAALARGLRRIQRATESPKGLLSPLYIDGDEEGTLTRLLSTHPPMDDRIRRLIRRAQSERAKTRTS